MSKLFECYIANPSHDEAVEIVERLVANGAEAHDVVKSMDIGYNKYAYNEYSCWGYYSGLGTYTNNSGVGWTEHAKQLTMQEFRDAFPCEKYDSTTEEWPQPGDEVVVSFQGKWDSVFIGKSPSGSYVCQMPKNYEHGAYDGFSKDWLGKPQSEREKFIEAATLVDNSVPNDAGLCDIQAMMGKLYDADFKAPEEK